MGVCYSSSNYRSSRKREGEWENDGDNGRKIDLKLKKSSSGDFATFISKLSGGGAAFASAAAAQERALHQIPGRLFANGASRIASLYTQQGKKGTNQDAMIVWENFCTRDDSKAIFCGVFDGHGPYGHMVARKVRDTIPILLRTEWEGANTPDGDQSSACVNGNADGTNHSVEFMDNEEYEMIENEDGDKFPEMHLPLKRSMLMAFKSMDKELKLHPTVDCFCSGSTAVILIMQGQDLVIGNVGDSRAVLATRDKDSSLKAVQLTVDLKPDLPREAARIQRCKGRVFALQDEPEVARVWLPNSDSPGLAMARAFGDFCLKDFGLISTPDVYYHHITEKDEFVVLATDGVWDVLSNKEAVDIVASAPSRATAARALVDCATRAWRLKYPTSKNDDCAVICLFLDHAYPAEKPKAKSEMNKIPTEGEAKSADLDDITSHSVSIVPSDANKESSEIVPVNETIEDKLPERSLGQSKRSLAECLSTAEDEEWSALEGITRVNSLLSIPRFLSFDKRSTSWRKWL